MVLSNRPKIAFIASLCLQSVHVYVYIYIYKASQSMNFHSTGSCNFSLLHAALRQGPSNACSACSAARVYVIGVRDELSWSTRDTRKQSVTKTRNPSTIELGVFTDEASPIRPKKYVPHARTSRRDPLRSSGQILCKPDPPTRETIAPAAQGWGSQQLQIVMACLGSAF